MSEAIVPLRTTRLLDPRLRINESREFGVLSGGSQVSWKPISTTSYSTTAAQFTAPPPSPGIVIDRKVLQKFTFQITFAGDTGDAKVPLLALAPDYFPADAPRAYPLSNGVLQTLAVTINNTAVSINMNDVMSALLWYNTNVEERSLDYSSTPSMLDQFQDYKDGYEQVRSPLAQYGDNTAEMSRGSFVYTVNSNTQTSAVVTLTISEYIYLSPFYFGKGNRNGFIGVQTMDFTYTFGDLTRLWSHDSTNGNVASFTSVSVTLPTAPQLLFNYITPKELSHIPKFVVYPYFSVDRYPTDGSGSLASGASQTISSNNIQLHSIPSRMYIYARERNADRTIYTSDVFAAINSITINFNNQSGLLSSATQQDLYKIAVENGCKQSFAQFSKFTGSVLALEFGKDIGLGDLQAPGLTETNQLQINVNITNPSSRSINYTLYVVPISQGTFTIMENRAVAQIGVVSKSNILDAKAAPSADFNLIENMYGGNFFSSIKDFFSKAASGVGDVVGTVLPYAKQAIDVYKTIRGAGPVGGARRRGMRRGGALISRRDLLDNARELEDDE